MYSPKRSWSELGVVVVVEVVGCENVTIATNKFVILLTPLSTTLTPLLKYIFEPTPTRSRVHTPCTGPFLKFNRSVNLSKEKSAALSCPGTHVELPGPNDLCGSSQVRSLAVNLQSNQALRGAPNKRFQSPVAVYRSVYICVIIAVR